MSELGKANETSMGLPRSGGSSSCGTGDGTKVVDSTHYKNSNNNNNSDNSNNKNSEARGSKRCWSEGDGEIEPPAKLLCTSPPHALCAEDVLHQPQQPCLPPTPAMTPHLCDSDQEDDQDERDYLDEEDKDSGFIDSNSVDNSSDDDMDVRISASDALTSVPDGLMSASDALTVVSDEYPLSSESSATVTSTLDKLSLSSLPSEDGTATPLPSAAPSTASTLQCTTAPPCTNSFHCTTPPISFTSSPALPSCSSAFSTYSPPSVEGSLVPSSFLQTPLSPPTPNPCSASSSSPCIIPPSYSASVPCSSLASCPTPSISEALSTSLALSVDILNTPPSLYSDPVLAPPCGDPAPTTVTAAYQGSVSTSAYDSYPYGDARLIHGSWSCNFYEGTGGGGGASGSGGSGGTNKYMEIQTSRQAIQCDANGKSYMELGSGAAYSQYQDCYTAAPSAAPYSGGNAGYTYTSTSYSQQQQPVQQQQQQPSQGVTLYRSGYSQYNNTYPNGENYPVSYDNGEVGVGGCAYSYPSPYARPLKAPPSRCVSPYCEPSKRANCYQQQRLSVLNLSMCKLNRFSRCPDPSLHKSVLVCNTLRLIERELDSEGTSMNALLSQQHMMQALLPPHCPPPPPTPNPPSEGPLPSMHPPLLGSALPGPCSPPPPVLPPPVVPPYSGGVQHYRPLQYSDAAYEEHLRPYSEEDPMREVQQCLLLSPPVSNSSISSSTTPVSLSSSTSIPSTSLGSTGSCVEERSEGSINWCSVLSLPSQSELDSLNNNDYCEWGGEAVEYSISRGSCGEEVQAPNWKLPSLSADDVLKSFPEAGRRPEHTDDLDNLINVLVES